MPTKSTRVVISTGNPASIARTGRRVHQVLWAALVGAVAASSAVAAEPQGMLETLHRHQLLASTVTDNGDLNPYAVVIAPVSAGKVAKDDVLVDNFNDVTNRQGTGTTIIDWRPSDKRSFLLANVPKKLAGCPGGVGLTTAMTMLKSGWIIVGSTPSTDGTTATKGDGCLIVLDPEGQVVEVWAGPMINDPWGDMAVVDSGSTATLFVSMAGFGLPAPNVLDPKTGYPVILHKATVLRVQLSIPQGKPPLIQNQTVVANGFSARADLDNFLLGPTGLALAPDGTLYVTDGLDNLIAAIPEALTRTTSAGTGRVVTQGELLSWPLAMVYTPAGHLLACNGKDGKVVEIDPKSGRQVYAQWIDPDQAQSPPGNGDLFGIALTPDGDGFYYVQDDTNTLMRASRR